MQKLLYMMAVHWRWIKQRPQMIAQMLAGDYEITVVYLKELFVRQSLRKEHDEPDGSVGIPAIPYRDKCRAAFRIQSCFFHKVMKNVYDFDLIWICHPLLFRYIPRDFRGKIVYDCMDNHEALCGDALIRRMIAGTERSLVQRADLSFASSEGLCRKIEAAGGKPVLIRNGVQLKEIHGPEPREVRDRYRIGYFGTIAEWFDFRSVLDSLDRFSDIEYVLWGPVSVSEVPSHPRLHFAGVVEHGQLWDKVRDCDCLIMPFQANDLIRDVDPVKLYEYISMGKCVISVYYGEIERFRPFVYFYDEEEPLEEVLERLRRTGFRVKYGREQQEKFLEENTWSERYGQICLRLQKMMEKGRLGEFR